MDMRTCSVEVKIRVRDLLKRYSAPDACVARLLCDKHDPSSVAYRVIAEDLSAVEITYGELRERSERLAAGFRSLGLNPGDRIATLMGRSVEYLITLLAIWRLGAVHVPLFTAFATPAIALRLRGSAAKLVVCDERQLPKLVQDDETLITAPWRIVTTAGHCNSSVINFDELLNSYAPGFAAAALGGDAPIIHIYTSGTTGSPKGVVVPAKALASFHAYAEFGLGLRSDDLYWCAADPGWAYGLYLGVIASFATGVRSLFYRGGFSPDITFAILEREGVTNFAAAPTVYRAMMAAKLPRGSHLKLRCASSAGEPLTPEINGWATSILGVPIHDHYGQTEAGMLINNHHDPALCHALKPGSMGHPMPGWSAVVLKEYHDEPAPVGTYGRVAFELSNSPLAWYSGYHNDPGKSTERFAGNRRWYVTGDTGRMDEDGYFYFSSRDDDVIIMAGYRIGPLEVESVILCHPDVLQCAVIGAPDSTRGEVIEAYVVPKSREKCTPLFATEIQQWVKDRYAAHAYPRVVHFVDDLPKTPSGKIQRAVLRQRRCGELLVTAHSSERK